MPAVSFVFTRAQTTFPSSTKPVSSQPRSTSMPSPFSFASSTASVSACGRIRMKGKRVSRPYMLARSGFDLFALKSMPGEV